MISFHSMEFNSSFLNAFDLFKHNKEFAKSHPSYFYPDNFICFCGSQGSGKTLTAVLYVMNLMMNYPKAILCTNIDLKYFPVDNKRVFRFSNAYDLKKYRNGEYGTIYLIDEIQLYFGSMKGSKNIDPALFQVICQQRKQRVHIVGTTQIYGKLEKSLREQFDTVIMCKKYLFNYKIKLLFINKDSVTDNSTNSSQELTAKVFKKIKYFINPDWFNYYDTYAVIDNPDLAVGVERSDTNDTVIKLSNNS